MARVCSREGGEVHAGPRDGGAFGAEAALHFLYGSPGPLAPVYSAALPMPGLDTGGRDVFRYRRTPPGCGQGGPDHPDDALGAFYSQRLACPEPEPSQQQQQRGEVERACAGVGPTAAGIQGMLDARGFLPPAGVGLDAGSHSHHHLVRALGPKT